MNTRHDDPQFRDLCRWYADEAHPDDMRNPKDLRWLVIAFFGAVLIAVALLAAGAAEAATAQLSCTAPTKNTDDTPISVTLTYAAYWGTSATSLPNRTALAGPGCKGPVVVPDPAPGASITYHFAVTAIAAGMESVKSNVATKTFSTPLPTPNPPTLLLTEGGLVWEAWPNWTNFSWKLGAQAGTIVAGVKCDATRRIGDSYYRVTAPIVWTNGKKNYVVAKCERKA